MEVREKDCYKSFREELFELWDKYCIDPIEALRYSEFRMFKATGDRAVYESAYFGRRKGLNAAAMLALIFPEDERYIVRLMDTIYAICDEYTWCLPAHQPSIDVNNNAYLDLFACETGYALAEIDALLNDRLEPLIRERIRSEYERRIVSSFDKQRFPWEHNTANWNAVCTGSVACSMMLLRPELVEKYKARFDENIEYYLSGFKDDGICEEGVGYWHYGFGFFTVYADMIRTFTDGKTDYFTRPKVKEVAAFLGKIYLSGSATVSFSDGGRSYRYHVGLLHYLKKEYPEDISIPDPENFYNIDNCGRWCLHLRSATWLKEEYLKPQAEYNKGAYYAGSSQWMVFRNGRYGFAAKAGHNAEPHNHNDVGSFIIAKSGRQVFTDLGAGAYTREYFSESGRYGILNCSSRGHSVPIVNGTYQHEGRELAAKNVKYENGTFSCDIGGAYPISELKSLVRSFSFAEESVTLTDCYDYRGEGDIVERFITLVEPEQVRSGEIRVDGVTMTYDPGKCDTVFSYEPISLEEKAYFIDLKLRRSASEITVTFTV